MNELFQRPANYWLRHADRHRQSGDLVRAAVLQRHAVHAQPDSEAAHAQYAYTLRKLCCYEASNREAFSALAAHPEQAGLYGLIGCNLLSMGLRRQGLDALEHYMLVWPSTAAPWHDEVCGMAEMYDGPLHPPKRQARLNGLLSIAAKRLARGDLDNAARALERVGTPPDRATAAHRELLMGVYWLGRHCMEPCVSCLQRAVSMDCDHVSTLVLAASLSHRIGAYPATRALLLRAACLAKTPSDQHMVCQTAEETNLLVIACAMLNRARQRQPNRCPLLFDLCVCALKMGKLPEAARHIHLCREIDPDDVPSALLFAQVMDWQQQNLSPRALRRAARAVSFYGSCTRQELDAMARSFMQALESGPQQLAQAICGPLRQKMFFLLTLPLDWTPGLLQIVYDHLPAQESEAILRQALMQHPADSAAKRRAMLMLAHMGAPAPYTLWTRDRFLLVDPNRLLAPSPSFRQRFLTLRIRRMARLCGRAAIPWALQVVSRMPRSQQLRLIHDPHRIWPLALALRYRALHGLPPVRISAQNLSTARVAALKNALRTLHRMHEGGSPYANH